MYERCTLLGFFYHHQEASCTVIKIWSSHKNFLWLFNQFYIIWLSCKNLLFINHFFRVLRQQQWRANRARHPNRRRRSLLPSVTPCRGHRLRGSTILSPRSPRPTTPYQPPSWTPSPRLPQRQAPSEPSRKRGWVFVIVLCQIILSFSSHISLGSGGSWCDLWTLEREAYDHPQHLHDVREDSHHNGEWVWPLIVLSILIFFIVISFDL